MNRFLSFTLIVLATVFGYVLYKQQDVGVINIGLGSFSIETSLLVFGAAIIALLFGVLMLLRLIERFSKGFSILTSRFKQYFAEKSKHALSDGLIDIAEGHYEKAEKRLLAEIKSFTDPFPVYLAAAAAAQEQGAYDRRDEYLQLAQEMSCVDKPKTEIAIGLIKAELQLAHNQPEQAIDTLESLENASPKHVRVLALLSEAYHRLSRWEQLRELINKLYKYKTLPNDKIRTLEMQAWHGLIKDSSTPDNAVFLCGLWDEAPAHLKTSNEFLEFYVCALKRINQDDDAAQLLLRNLNHNWQDSLVVLYAGLDVSADDKQLETTEAWLKEHPDNAHLLLILGKMCLRLSLWGKARSYLEASLCIAPLPETCLRLATLLEEHMDEAEVAQDYYRKGLHLLVDEKIPVTTASATIKNNSQPRELQPRESKTRLKIVPPK